MKVKQKDYTENKMAKRSASTKSNNKKDQKRRHTAAASHFKGKREIVFDPEARKAYLQGFSERKRQRRAFGLAMQKVKDRKAKLEERKQIKKEELQRVEEAEQQKAVIMEEMLKQQNQTNEKDQSDDEADESDVEGSEEEEAEGTESREKAILDMKTYDDEATETHWGGLVTVTTSVVALDEGDSSDDDANFAHGALSKKKKSIDKQQQYAGNVEKYMSQLKGNMPGKKKAKDSTGHHAKRKGKNGAADMKGVGGAANLKLAQKVLSKAKAKHGAVSKEKNKGGKKKGRR